MRPIINYSKDFEIMFLDDILFSKMHRGNYKCFFISCKTIFSNSEIFERMQYLTSESSEFLVISCLLNNEINLVLVTKSVIGYNYFLEETLKRGVIRELNTSEEYEVVVIQFDENNFKHLLYELFQNNLMKENYFYYISNQKFLDYVELVDVVDRRLELFDNKKNNLKSYSNDSYSYLTLINFYLYYFNKENLCCFNRQLYKRIEGTKSTLYPLKKPIINFFNGKENEDEQFFNNLEQLALVDLQQFKVKYMSEFFKNIFLLEEAFSSFFVELSDMYFDMRKR